MIHLLFLDPSGASTICGKLALLTPILPSTASVELKGVASPWHQIYMEFSSSSRFCTEPWMSECCDFPSLFKGFMMHYYAKPFEQAWKVTAFTHSWLLINSTVYTSCLGKNHLLLLGWEVYTKGGGKGGIPVGGFLDDGGPPGSWREIQVDCEGGELSIKYYQFQ